VREDGTIVYYGGLYNKIRKSFSKDELWQNYVEEIQLIRNSNEEAIEKWYSHEEIP
jgi:hypothetical protein